MDIGTITRRHSYPLFISPALSNHQPHFNFHPVPRIAVPFQPANSRFQPVSFIQQTGGGQVLDAGDVPQFAAVPVDADGVGIEGVGGLAGQFQAVADGQLVPQGLALMVLESGEGALLDEEAASCGFLGGGGYWQGGKADCLGKALYEVTSDHGTLCRDVGWFCFGNS